MAIRDYFSPTPAPTTRRSTRSQARTSDSSFVDIDAIVIDDSPAHNTQPTQPLYGLPFPPNSSVTVVDLSQTPTASNQSPRLLDDDDLSLDIGENPNIQSSSSHNLLTCLQGIKESSF